MFKTSVGNKKFYNELQTQLFRKENEYKGTPSMNAVNVSLDKFKVHAFEFSKSGQIITATSTIASIPVKQMLSELVPRLNAKTSTNVVHYLALNQSYGTYLALLYLLTLTHMNFETLNTSLIDYVMLWEAPFAMKAKIFARMATGDAPTSKTQFVRYTLILAALTLSALVSSYSLQTW